ncbi:MAG: TonB-dependent receptor [Pseudomonadota bacterium]
MESSEDLARRTPNVVLPTFGDSGSSAQPIVRGVGVLQSVLSPDNATVPTIIDGVPLTGFGSAIELFILEKVEVLRGPQGTAFGRHSTAGAIIITTAKPDAVPERSVTFAAGDDGYWAARGVLSGQIAEDVFGRFAFSYRQHGAYVDNEQQFADDIGESQVGAARGTLRFAPNGATEVTLGANYENDDRDTSSVVQLRDRNTFQDTPPFQRTLAGTTANVTHEAERFTFHSVTGYQYYDAEFSSDITDGYVFEGVTGFPPEFFIEIRDEFSDDIETEMQLYQGLHLISPEASAIGRATGVVASLNDFSGSHSVRSNFFVTSSGDREIDLKNQSYAVFGDVYVPVGAWECGLGARYSYEIREFDGTYIGTGLPDTVPVFVQDDRETYGLFSGRASIGYKPTEESLVYASYNRGAKAGGFSRSWNNAALGVPEEPYPQTTVDAFEIGAKGELMGDRQPGRPRPSGTKSKMSRSSHWTPTPSPSWSKVWIFGRAALSWKARHCLGRGFSLSAALGYTDAEITGVPAGNSSGAEKGNDVPNVPKLTVSLSLDYRNNPGILGLGLGEEIAGFIGYRYQSERPVDVANSFDLNATHLIDAQLGLSTESWRVYAFVENLLDETIEQQGAAITPSVQSVLTSRGRTVGLGAQFVF